MEVGQTLEPLQKEEITHTQLVRYAGASGDFNPIHTVVPFAEAAGLGGGHCTWHVGYGLCRAGNWAMVRSKEPEEIHNEI
ncbi:acyl dehydratase [Solibacillus kalamii]|nr:acyl dehydratase [Solibacillus kalamii]